MATKVVGVADCSVSADATDLLSTYALGSCIAVTMYDDVAKVGGMLHFLLPDQTAETNRRRNNPFICADTGIPEMVAACLKLGALKHRLKVHAVGGANIVGDPGIFDIGKRNHLSLRKVLWKAGLLLQAEAVGGERWRTVRLEMATGKVWVKEGSESEVELSAKTERCTRSNDESAIGR